MLDITSIRAGDKIAYVGPSISAFGGVYSVLQAEQTYRNPEDCPDHEKGKLMIAEFMNDGTPMFFTLDHLIPHEWRKV